MEVKAMNPVMGELQECGGLIKKGEVFANL
jgi:hypothetical protein